MEDSGTQNEVSDLEIEARDSSGCTLLAPVDCNNGWCCAENSACSSSGGSGDTSCVVPQLGLLPEITLPAVPGTSAVTSIAPALLPTQILPSISLPNIGTGAATTTATTSGSTGTASTGDGSSDSSSVISSDTSIKLSKDQTIALVTVPIVALGFGLVAYVYWRRRRGALKDANREKGEERSVWSQYVLSKSMVNFPKSTGGMEDLGSGPGGQRPGSQTSKQAILKNNNHNNYKRDSNVSSILSNDMLMTGAARSVSLLSAQSHPDPGNNSRSSTRSPTSKSKSREGR